MPSVPLDEAFFRSSSYKGPAITIPTGLSLEEYPLSPLPSDPTLFFIGALDWLPNQEGLTWFLDKVFERLVAAMPELEFHIAGRNAPKQFVKRLHHRRIIYHGEVDDARKFIQSFRVMVAPLLSGSGIRIKILEGMALGRPVVTTSVGIKGIDAENINVDPRRMAINLGAGLISCDLVELAPAMAASAVEGKFDIRKWGREGSNWSRPCGFSSICPI